MNFVLDIDGTKDAESIMTEIGVSTEGIPYMATKAVSMVVYLENVHIGAANILKQEMLSIGGDAAVTRGVVNGKAEISNVVLVADKNRINKLIQKLQRQSIFGLGAVREDLQKQLQPKPQCLYYTLPTKGEKELSLETTRIMGILNVTPDSFSDGNQFYHQEEAVQRALQMEKEGADIIDIGGESSRPGAKPLTVEEECARVLPVIQELSRKIEIPISIDTYHSQTAIKAIEAGVSIVNDISALEDDALMGEALVSYPHVSIILMHKKGCPQTMQDNPHYVHVIKEMMHYFEQRLDFCDQLGINRDRIILDPGIGFGKRLEDNLLILKHIEVLHSFKLPVLLAASRKSFINQIVPSTPTERLAGTLATTAIAVNKGIQVIRVHDVKENYQLIQTLQAVKKQTWAF